jgi:tetratricopeptide (TPR) repeat protein
LKTKWIIVSGIAIVAVAIAALVGFFIFSGKSKIERAPRFEAALKPLFEDQGIGSPFRAFRETRGWKQTLVIQFSPTDAVKQKHGKKEMLMLPLALAGHGAKVLDPKLDAVEIRSANKDESAVRMQVECKDIQRFFQKDISLATLNDRASFEVIPWQPDAKSDNDRAQQYLERGRMFANEKDDPERAFACFEKANALRPGDVDILFALGMTQAALGNGPTSIEYLEKARRAKPGELRVHSALARCYIANKQLDQAGVSLKQFAILRGTARTSDPFYEPALYQAAEACFALKSYQDTELLLRELLQISPQHGHGWALLGKTQYNLKKKKEALASFRKAAELKPRDARLLLQLGAYLSELKDYQAAAVAYRASYTLGNRDVDLFTGLSNAYNASGKYFDAKHVLAEGFRYHLNDPGLERNFRASHRIIVKKGLKPNGPPSPIALTQS